MLIKHESGVAHVDAFDTKIVDKWKSPRRKRLLVCSARSTKARDPRIAWCRCCAKYQNSKRRRLIVLRSYSRSPRTDSRVSRVYEARVRWLQETWELRHESSCVWRYEESLGEKQVENVRTCHEKTGKKGWEEVGSAGVHLFWMSEQNLTQIRRN